jgi:secondary thiamine-phosphate synthase enzyme
MAYQDSFDIHSRGRGSTEITAAGGAYRTRCGSGDQASRTSFVLHTSCSLVLTENADPSVRRDLETLAARWAPDADPAYRHDCEGDDDMAAHGRSIVAGVSVTVPVSNGALRLGTWQGIYLWEHRTMSHHRTLVVVTIIG